MQVIATIYEDNADPTVTRDNFRERNAARAVVMDPEGRVALLRVGKHSYHKLPGGGIEAGEDTAAALSREMLEEIGCTIDVQKEIGIVTEFRDQWQMRQHSHCYLAVQTGEKGQPAYTDEELADGFEIVWAPNLAEAILLLEADTPVNYEGPLILSRDLVVLRAAAALNVLP